MLQKLFALRSIACNSLMPLGLTYSLLYAAPGFGACVSIPKMQGANSDKPASVEACETEDAYTLSIVGRELHYSKAYFQARLRSLLQTWINSNAPEPERYKNAQIDFWLAVPEADPSATQARAVVRAGLHSFVAYLRLEGGEDAPDQWTVHNGSVSILGAQTYPKSFGFRAGTLLIKASDQTSVEDLSHYLHSFGVTLDAPINSSWWAASVSAFQEKAARASIRSDTQQENFIQGLEFNQIVEWIAYRERVFSFDLAAP